ncbi:hypothetical protein LPL18_011450 [Halomonas sp. CUBES01]|uniref:hypothetical protein n=1 Tax=Halomonas sp. CUBES01 TaxID=2897340 RepID=UPI001E483FE7|nr:hypothetical protein [Halomonas sp. CUBES01]MEC4767940.1 hypothetical protein [Halomonas sp. CUBES01]
MGRAISSSAGPINGGGIKSVQRGEYAVTVTEIATFPINKVNPNKCQLKVFLGQSLNTMLNDALAYDCLYTLSETQLEIDIWETAGYVEAYNGTENTAGAVAMSRGRFIRWELIEYA